MQYLISTLVVLFVFISLFFIGGLIRQYISGLFEFDLTSTQPSRCRRKYGKLIKHRYTSMLTNGRVVDYCEMKREKL